MIRQVGTRSNDEQCRRRGRQRGSSREAKDGAVLSLLQQEGRRQTGRREVVTKKSVLKNHHPDTRYCCSGHVLRTRMDPLQRQRYTQKIQHLPSDIYREVSCNVCSHIIREEPIGGCCLVCDIDFCQLCYYELEGGKLIEELLAEATINDTSHRRTITNNENVIPSQTNVNKTTIVNQQYDLPMSATASSSSVEGTSSLPSNNSAMSFLSTKEYCGVGHELYQVLTIERQQYIRDRDSLHVLPIIECDCCSKKIMDEYIAGSCEECDLDICTDCFKNGQSYQDVIKMKVEEDDDEEEKAGPVEHSDDDDEGEIVDKRRTATAASKDRRNDHHSEDNDMERYNRRRPTYKGAGRVNYDDYPDPTVYQWVFTGSNKSSGVEYFEKDFGGLIGRVKLDFYYSRGSVKTFLVHPTDGTVSCLFTKSQYKLSSHSYRKILKDPRSHTDRRYIDKKQRRLG